jgi:hypothetical protein
MPDGWDGEAVTIRWTSSTPLLRKMLMASRLPTRRGPTASQKKAPKCRIGGRGGSLNAGANQARRKQAWSIIGDRLTIHQPHAVMVRRMGWCGLNVPAVTFIPSASIAFANCFASFSVGKDFVCFAKGARFAISSDGTAVLA